MRINSYSSSGVKRLAKALKVLSEANRLRILLNLGIECRPVTEIVKATGLSQTNVSFHLRALREAGLVKPERRGQYIYYCLHDSQLLGVLDDLSVWLETRAAGAPQAARAKRQSARARQANSNPEA
ncbi:MAG: ArsR/SmtB family transcription factor [Sulfuricaulis sp.]